MDLLCFIIGAKCSDAKYKYILTLPILFARMGWQQMIIKTNTYTCSELDMSQPKPVAKKMKTFVHVFLLTASLPFVVCDQYLFSI